MRGCGAPTLNEGQSGESRHGREAAGLSTARSGRTFDG